MIFLYLKRRNKRTKGATTTEEDPGSPAQELEDQDREHADRKWFLEGNWRSEVRTENPSRELDSRAVNVVPGPPVELDAAEKGQERIET